MDEELKQLLAKAEQNLTAVKGELETQKSANVDNAERTKALEAQAKLDAQSIEDMKNELADFEKKFSAQPTVVVSQNEQNAAIKAAIHGAMGSLIKSGGVAGDKSGEKTFKSLVSDVESRIKTLNLTNTGEGLESVATVLSREICHRAREAFPILGAVGHKTMARDYKQSVLISYPSVQEGIENVAGADIAETDTPTYAEVASKVAKINAKPRITDEAMLGSDLDIYGDLMMLLDEEVGRKWLMFILFGNGTGKSMRGILSSTRVDITNSTGESFKATIDSATPANARDVDYYPVYPTGVSGSFGATDKAVVDYTISLKNRLPTKYLGAAAWYMNRTTLEIFEKVRDAQDRPIFKDNYQGAGLSLHGYPVVIDDNMPNVAADSTPIIFGALAQAFYISEGDINKVLIDPYTVDGNTVVKLDQEMFEIMGKNDAIIIAACTTNS